MIFIAVASGSSPLARGTRAGQFCQRIRHGLIPARAGNTLTDPNRKEPRWAHPRSRGEHVILNDASTVGAGSSPLARGTQADSLGIGHLYGLIPARAGNTWRSLALRRLQGAHPRSRGEHRHSIPIEREFAGSSPLARGTLCSRLDSRKSTGLIPARAGNTAFPIHRYPACGAHPRSRGEHTC